MALPHQLQRCATLWDEPGRKQLALSCGDSKPGWTVSCPLLWFEHTDYEVELAIAIGRQARYLDAAQAVQYIAGYTICIDYSERDWQKNRSGQFVKGKSSDTFAPMGPYLVPADEIDPSDLRLRLAVNGEPRQDATTADMIFDVPTIVASISEYMTLLPGDVITTGTPSGVGLGHDPPVFLREGDVVEYSIEGIGEGRQEVVLYAPE